MISKTTVLGGGSCWPDVLIAHLEMVCSLILFECIGCVNRICELTVHIMTASHHCFWRLNIERSILFASKLKMMALEVVLEI